MKFCLSKKSLCFFISSISFCNCPSQFFKSFEISFKILSIFSISSFSFLSFKNFLSSFNDIGSSFSFILISIFIFSLLIWLVWWEFSDIFSDSIGISEGSGSESDSDTDEKLIVFLGFLLFDSSEESEDFGLNCSPFESSESDSESKFFLFCSVINCLFFIFLFLFVS